MVTLLTLEALEADRRYVERQLAEPIDDPWGTTRLMWQHRLRDILRQIEESNTTRVSYASVALVFGGNPVIGSSDIRVDFTTDALASFQKLVTVRLAERERQAAGESAELPKRGRLPGVKNSNLFIRDLVRGSMGFILEELPEQAELLPTRLKEVVESTTELLGQLNAATDVQFQTIILNSEPRVVQAIQKFTQVLFQAGASTKIAGDNNQIALSIADVDLMSKRLNDISVSEEIEIVDGVLQGLLPEKLEFEFKQAGEGSVTVRGDVSEELARKYMLDAEFVERLLQKPGRARIKIIRTIRNGVPSKEQRVMEALEPGTLQR